MLPAVKIDCAVPKVEANATATTFIDVSEWNVNKVSKGINAIKNLPLVVVPDSCCSNTVIATGVKSSNATAAAVSDNSDDDTATASVSKDAEEDDTTSSTASAINLLDDGGNVLDDILFDALKGIDGFYENSSCAL